jgi:flagellar motor switch protein FliN
MEREFMMNNEEYGQGDGDGGEDLAAVRAKGGDALDRILDLPLVIHVELGNRRLRISELLEIAVGSVIDLDTAAGAPLEIFANHTLIAQGEPVVVGDHYGIRITEIVAPAERVKRLGNRGGGSW